MTDIAGSVVPAAEVVAAVGTSGWAYPSWRPGFYPAGLRPDGFLGFYASCFRAVELNASGYRLPAEDQLARWAAAVPDGFRFAAKAPRFALRDPTAVVDRLRELGDHLGCVRVVVESRRSDALLTSLLAAGGRARLALDLRDPSWDGVEPELAAAGAVRVGDWDAPGPWRYLRFREPSWSERDLRVLSARLRPLVEDGVDVLAFFRHDDLPAAPAAAARLLQLLGV